MVSLNRVEAFFRGFGFEGERLNALAGRFGADEEAVRSARYAATAWLATVAGRWAGESIAGFAAARAAFVRAGVAARYPDAFLNDDVPAELTAVLAAARPMPLPTLMPMPMVPQDVRMLPVIDDVLRSLLPLAPRRS